MTVSSTSPYIVWDLAYTKQDGTRRVEKGLGSNPRDEKGPGGQGK